MPAQEGTHGKDRAGKSRYRWLLLSLAVNLFLLSFVVSHEAWHFLKRHEQPPGPPPPPSEMLLEAAHMLSPDGQKVVEQAVATDESKLLGLHDALVHAHQAAEKIYKAESFDTEAYRQAIAVQLDSGRQLFGEISQLLLQVGPLLSQSDRELLMQHMKGPRRPGEKR